MNDQAIEQEIQAKGKTALRITPADIEANVAAIHTFTAGDALRALGHPVGAEFDLLTLCVAKTTSGYTLTGESACASPENFDAELGAKIARDNAKQKLWPLMGYELKPRLAAAEAKQQAERDAQASRPNQNCVFKYCPDEAECRAHGCTMGAPSDSA